MLRTIFTGRRRWGWLAATMLAALVFAAATAAREGAARENAALDARIARIERGLLPGTRIKGRPAEMRLAERMAHYHVPGVSVAVINRGAIEWAKGYGVAEAGAARPVTPETRFQAASISKPVAAMAALALVERGVLRLDEDVNLSLASWKVPDSPLAKEQKVTLRRLLTHSAGLTVHGFPGYVAGSELPTLVQVLDGAKPANTAAVRVGTTPGTKWDYSGGGYTVMQLLLTEKTREAFPKLLEETVLRPLGMTRSAYQQPLSAEWAPLAATAHDLQGKPIEGKWHVYPEMAAAGLWTTPSDLARFAIAIQEAKAGKPHKVLSRGMIDQMTARQFENWGLGPEVGEKNGVPSFGHSGGNEGFRCHMVAFVGTGQGAVVMTNGDNGYSLLTEILRAISREYGWPDWQSEERAVAKIDPALFGVYQGDYELEPGALIALRREGDALVATAPGQPPVTMYPESETTFFAAEGMAMTLTFQRDGQGAATGVVLRVGGQDRLLKKVK